ncbi:ATP-dependent translocase ABCB1-like isoform X1 [Tachypleus tridentatus]|uniref:ATP-dependent translocase ABCB1-like isoform X1 n=2 Tax=Tachypleus tridentatus TaxID=6853 RepID=UPI003FD64C26
MATKPNTDDEEKQPLLGKQSQTRPGQSYDTTNKRDNQQAAEEPKPKVSLRALFRYASLLDKFLIILGSLFAFVHGAGWPMLALIFGEMTNTFVQQAQSGFLVPENQNLVSTVSSTLLPQTFQTVVPDVLLKTILSKSTKHATSINSSLITTVLPNEYNTSLFLKNYSATFTNRFVPVTETVNIYLDDLQTTENTNSSQSPLVPKFDETDNSSSNITRSAVTSLLKAVMAAFAPEGYSGFDSIPSTVFESMMNQYSLYYVYIGIAVFVASYSQIVCWMLACERQVYRLRQEFFYEIMRQEISWFDKHQSGELTTRLNDDLERIREGIGDKFSMFIQYAATFLSGFVVGFFVGWELTLVIMSLTPLLALSSAFMGKMIASSSAREQEKYAQAGSVAEEVLGNIRTVAVFRGEKREVTRYTEALLAGKKVAIRKYIFISIGLGFTFLVLYGSYALAFWYGSVLILNGSMDPGSVFTVFFAVLIGSFSLGNAVPHLTAIATAKGAAGVIFNIVDNKPKIDPYSDKGIFPQHMTPNIELRKVNFNYPCRKTVQVLKDVSFTVKEGQTVALCGSSGSGKSTIISLLLRFYDPQKGSITIDGYSLTNLNVRWLRSIIGVVNQEPILFGCSIAENIRYGCDNATFQEIIEAAKMANAHEFIINLPEAYDTLVGDRGAQLSGGQKQRVAIARALVRDPKILLLDEATSALDSESEATVQRALDKARQGRTTIVVAHRLSTIKDADIIYAMENGEIKENGTHQELMDKEGVYYTLVMNQMFTDQSGYSTSEQAGESSRALKRRKSFNRSRSISQDREVSRLISEVNEEEVVLPSAFHILKSAAPEWAYIVVAVLASIVVGGTMPAFAVFYSEIFATFTLVGDDLKNAAFFWSMMFLVLAAATAFGHFFRTTGTGFAGEELTMRLRHQTFKNIIRQNIGWFDEEKHSTGKLSTRLATDVPMVKTAAGHRIGTVVSAVVTLFTSLVIAFVFGWKLALGLLVVVPILLVAGAVQMKVLKGNQKRDSELMENAGNVASEGLENIRTVQALTQEQTFFEKYVGHLLVPYMENKKHAQVYAIAFAFSQGVMFLIYAAAFRLGSYLITIGDMDATNVYRVFFAMAFSAVSVGQWTSFLPDYTKARLSAGLIFHLIKKTPSIDIYSNGGVRPKIRGALTFEDVHFRYPCRRDVAVLRGINLNVQRGQTLALVGPSGCGKSTIVSLIERFYDPQKGHIKVDNYDIQTLNLSYLRKHIAVVSQEPVLFNCTIAENIKYGIEDHVTQQQIENVAQIANIHNFIRSLPQGYNTMVGERGTQLSGGQKQRIAIARALVRDPKILLLDEATSALDTESEKLVQEALDQAQQGRTCIVIAHRLSTIQGADCIAVIDRGKIVEQGNHEQLLLNKGVYYHLTKRQRIIK